MSQMQEQTFNKTSAATAGLPQSEDDGEARPVAWDVMTAYQQIASRKVMLIDARTHSAYTHLRIPDARSIPMQTLGEAGALLKDINQTTPICVYCSSGALSKIAAAAFARCGYTEVYYIKTGFDGWQQKRLPCVTEINGELVQVVIDRVGFSAPVLVLN